jgi:hypothetical protein
MRKSTKRLHAYLYGASIGAFGRLTRGALHELRGGNLETIVAKIQMGEVGEEGEGGRQFVSETSCA